MKPEQLKYSILKKAFSGQLVMVDPDSEKPKVKAVELEETPFDIPDDWFWSNLGNCCEMYTGNSISETVKKTKYAGLKEGYDYIATKDVTFEHTIEYDNGVRIPVDDDFRIAYNGSVLMCIEGGSAGRKIGILDRDVCFGNKLCTFNSKEIVNRYIYYYLQSHEFKAFFMDNMSGIIGGVSIKKLKELPIPVPTVSEQKAIVAKIEELLPYVDRYVVAYEKLEQFNAKFPEDMKKSILQYAIQGKLVEQRPEEGTAEELYQQIQAEKQKLIKEGKIKKEKPLPEISEDEVPFDIPESWKWCRLNNVSFAIGDIDHRMPRKVVEGIPYISPLDFTDTGIDYDHAKKISKEDYDILSVKFKPTQNDIIFPRYGTIGKIRIIDTDREVLVSYSCCTIKNLDNYMDYKFIAYVLQSSMIKQEIERYINKTTQPNVGLQSIKLFMFPLPPLAEQHRIVAKIEELLPYCDRLAR